MSPHRPTHHIMVREKGQPGSLYDLRCVYMCICRFACAEDNDFYFIAKRKSPLVAEPEGGWGIGNGTGQGTGESKAEGGASIEEKGPDCSGSTYRLQYGHPCCDPHSFHSLPMSTLPCLHRPSVILTFLPTTWSHLKSPLNISRMMSQSLEVHSS